jgi:hypothetical protein
MKKFIILILLAVAVVFFIRAGRSPVAKIPSALAPASEPVPIAQTAIDSPAHISAAPAYAGAIALIDSNNAMFKRTLERLCARNVQSLKSEGYKFSDSQLRRIASAMALPVYPNCITRRKSPQWIQVIPAM